MRLATCPECNCHVKVDEATCPFCDAALPSDMVGRVQNRGIDPTRFGRAAFVSFTAAAVASSTGACASNATPAYGAPVETGGQAGAAAGGTGGAALGTGGMGTGGSVGATGGLTGTGGAMAMATGGDVGQPVYGVPFEPMPQPEYGVAIDFDATAPPQDAANPVQDAGADANIADAADDGASNTIKPVPVPVYGVPISPKED